ncbi:MAG: hypothetical protein AB7N80_14175 [Bdellovibrionales bacterium]
MKSEILEVSEVCPDTDSAIRVILMKCNDHFEIVTETKERIGVAFEFIETGRQTVRDEKSARAQFQLTVDQIASLDSLE